MRQAQLTFVPAPILPKSLPTVVQGSHSEAAKENPPSWSHTPLATCCMAREEARRPPSSPLPDEASLGQPTRSPNKNQSGGQVQGRGSQGEMRFKAYCRAIHICENSTADDQRHYIANKIPLLKDAKGHENYRIKAGTLL